MLSRIVYEVTFSYFSNAGNCFENKRYIKIIDLYLRSKCLGKITKKKVKSLGVRLQTLMVVVGCELP